MVAADTQPLLTVDNFHSADCGSPPSIRHTLGDKSYVSYFEGKSADQWLFVADFKTKRAFLQCGDLGWGEAIQVEGAAPEGLVLDPAERLWLDACLMAVRDRPRRQV
jgi:hypothetical protein